MKKSFNKHHIKSVALILIAAGVIMINGVCLNLALSFAQQQGNGVVRSVKMTQGSTTGTVTGQSSAELPKILDYGDAAQYARRFETVFIGSDVSSDIVEVSRGKESWIVTMMPKNISNTLYRNGYSFMMKEDGTLENFDTIYWVGTDKMPDHDSKEKIRQATADMMSKLGIGDDIQVITVGTNFELLSRKDKRYEFQFTTVDGNLKVMQFNCTSMTKQ